MFRSLLLGAVAACTSGPEAVDTSTAVDTGLAVSPSADPSSDPCAVKDWWLDLDRDGTGDPDTRVEACSQPVDHVDNGADCDDGNADNHPANPERCDGLDQDCTGVADDGLADLDFWPDVDRDGHGDGNVSPVRGCSAAPGGVTSSDDCDDTDPDRFPGNPERCDGLDQDCDSAPDDGLVFAQFFTDADQDGAGDDTRAVSTCDGAPTGTVSAGGDCDDTDPDRFPGNPERCDDRDQDCDNDPDDGLVFAQFFADTDQDGFGDDSQGFETCDGAPAGTVAAGGDCDDTDPDRFPGNPERCDDRDQDCDELADDGLVFADYWPDVDGDGFGDDTRAVATCDGMPAGTILVGGDCDDTDPLVYPEADASECDRVDTDCDGVVEEVRVPEDHATLQAAIDAAQDGGLVCVAAGTYGGEAVIDGKELVVRGEGSVLDGVQGPVLELISAGASEISGFVLTGASGTAGVGLRSFDSAPLLRDLEVSGNTCSTSALYSHCLGVGISIESSSATLENVVIADNTGTATEYVHGVGLYVLDSDVTLRDVVVSGNVADADYISGVGIAVDAGSDLVAERLSLLDNLGLGSTNANGVAIDTCFFPSASLDLTDVVIEGNTSTAPSGDIVNLCDGPSHALVRITIRDNQGDRILRTTDLTLENLLMADNISYDELIEAHGSLVLEQATITANTIFGTPQYIGPLVDGAGDLTLRNSVIAHNRWFRGVMHPPWSTAYTFDVPVDSRYTDFYLNAVLDPNPVGTLWNIAVDPELDGDHRPLPTSPVIDAGDPGVLDPDGTRSDLGAFGGPHAFP